jgi:hypothetical protein
MMSQQLYFFPDDNNFRNSFCEDFLSKLAEYGFFEYSLNNLRLLDDCLLLDLFYCSLLPLKVIDDDSSINYSCYYCSATLVFVIVKFTKTRKSEYFFESITSVNKDLKRKVSIFFDDYYDLDFNKFGNLKNNHNFYTCLKLIYIDKIILNDYFFHSVIISCFKNYYYCNQRPNILYDKSGDLVNRLVP